MRLRDFDLEKQLGRVHAWIKAADQKINIAFALENGVLVAVSIPTAKFILGHPDLLSNYLLFILLAEAVALAAIAEINALLALMPRVKPRKNIDSAIYFGSIAQKSADEYRKQIRKLKQSDLADDLLNQIVISADIANKKHTCLNNSLLSFALAMLMLIAFLVIGAIQVSS